MGYEHRTMQNPHRLGGDALTPHDKPKRDIRLRLIVNGETVDEQELEMYSEVIIHTQPDKIRITPATPRVIKLK